MTGTSQWTMNVVHMTNAKKGPKKDFNAYKDFSEVELDAQIIICCIMYFGMETIDGKIHVFVLVGISVI